MMVKFKRFWLPLGLVLLLPGAVGPAQAQGAEEGWQVYTNGNFIYDLALEGGGALGGGYTWVATGGGVVCYSASQRIKFTTFDGLASSRVEAIAKDDEGRLWFATYGGVSVLDDGGTPLHKADDTWTAFTTADNLASNWVDAIGVDSGGRWWFGTWGGGASVLDDAGTVFDKRDDTWTTFTATDGLAGHCVWAITEDVGGRLWFGTYGSFCTGGGVSVLDDAGTPFDKEDDTWATFTTTDGLADDDIPAIAVDGETRLWFAT